MRFEYVTVYALLGVSTTGKEVDKEIVRFPAHEAVAVLTNDLDKYCFNADRGKAAGVVMLKHLSRQLQEEGFKSALEREILSLRKERTDRYGKATFLVFRATGDIDVPHKDEKSTAEYEDFSISLDTFDKEAVKNRFQGAVNGVLSAIFLAMSEGNTPNAEKVTDNIYLVDADGKICYYSLLFGSATFSVASPLTVEAEQFVDRYAQRLSEDKEIIRVVKLLMQSLQTRSDNLRSFLSAWAAIEIFINRVYAVYKDESSLSSADRARSKNSDLFLKFIAISALLTSTNVEADLDEFERLKSFRNKLVHPLKLPCEVADADLPTTGVQTLLRKYLRLYIEKPVISTPS